MLLLIDRNLHLTPEGFLEILNRGASNHIKDKYPNIIPQPKLVRSILPDLTSNWVSGFVAGEEPLNDLTTLLVLLSMLLYILKMLKY